MDEYVWRGFPYEHYFLVVVVRAASVEEAIQQVLQMARDQNSALMQMHPGAAIFETWLRDNVEVYKASDELSLWAEHWS